MILHPEPAICFLWLAMAACSNTPSHEDPVSDETPAGEAVLEQLVGNWAAEEREDFPGFIRQECQWILNRKYLEIKAVVDIPPQPKSSWRTLIAYDPMDNSYRLWNFSDDGVVTTEQGTWDSKWKAIKFEGRNSTGRESFSSLKITNKNTIVRSVGQYLTKDRSRSLFTAFSLKRVSTVKTNQQTQED